MIGITSDNDKVGYWLREIRTADPCPNFTLEISFKLHFKYVGFKIVVTDESRGFRIW